MSIHPGHLSLGLLVLHPRVQNLNSLRCGYVFYMLAEQLSGFTLSSEATVG